MSHTPLVTDGSGPSPVSTGAQTFNGAKTFTNGVQGPGTVPIGAIMPVVNASPITGGGYTIPPSGTVDTNGWQLCDGVAIPGGNTLTGSTPNLSDGRYLRGSTTSGSTGGANTFTPAGTNATSNVAASGLTFSGTGINPSTTFAGAGNFTDSISVPASGLTFSGTGVNPSSTFAAAGNFTDSVSVPASGLTFSGTGINPSSTFAAAGNFTDSVSVPGHYHGMGTGATLNITSSGTTTVTGTVGGTDGTHRHRLNYGSGQLGNGAQSIVGGLTNDTGIQTELSGHSHSFGLTAPNHTHAVGNFAGVIGLGSGVDGNAATFTASGTATARSTWFTSTNYTPAGSIAGTATGTGAATARSTWFTSTTYTPAGSIAGTATGTGTATARSNWFTSTTYTPAGSIGGTATAAAQAFTGTQGNNEPQYLNVRYLIRVK